MNKTSTKTGEYSLSSSCRQSKSDPSQPARASNVDAIVSYYESGINKPGTSGGLGIELEHIVVRNNLHSVSYSEPEGIKWLLEQLEPSFPQITRDREGDLLGVSRPGAAVTLEPAAQVELSAGPFEGLDEAKCVFDQFENQLSEALTPLGKRALTLGYHPTATAQSLELIPKRRYQFMNLYLGERSFFAPCMMRGSASTQISIDYFSVDDCLRKLRLAYALVPLFSLISDNAAVFEGAPRSHKLIRTEIWQKCDPDRCGLVPKVMDSDFTLRNYAEYVLDTPAILTPCRKEEWCYSRRTFGEIYGERTMTRTEVEHAVSMLFNDVRLKTYLEIRPADSMPIPFVVAYAGLIKGLFYHPENLDALDDLFKDVRNGDVEDAKNELMEKGYEAQVYGRPVATLCDAMLDLAQKGLDDDERPYLEPLESLIARRVTLADMAEGNQQPRL